MKNILLVTLTMLAVTTSFAATEFKFLPLNQNAIVFVRGQDADFEKLYQVINVPEKDTSAGKGKGLKSSDKGLNLACNLTKKVCQVVINKGVNSLIDSENKKTAYHATGALANELAQLFHLDENGILKFTTSDQKMALEINENGFIFTASELN